MATDRLLTAKEYAEMKRVHVDTVRRWVREGSLPSAEKLGGSIRIPAQATVTHKK